MILSGRDVRDNKHIPQLIVAAMEFRWRERQKPFLTHRYKHVEMHS